MAKTNPISVRLEPEVKAALERMAKAQGRKVAAQAAWVITVGVQPQAGQTAQREGWWPHYMTEEKQKK